MTLNVESNQSISRSRNHLIDQSDHNQMIDRSRFFGRNFSLFLFFETGRGARFGNSNSYFSASRAYGRVLRETLNFSLILYCFSMYLYLGEIPKVFGKLQVLLFRGCVLDANCTQPISLRQGELLSFCLTLLALVLFWPNVSEIEFESFVVAVQYRCSSSRIHGSTSPCSVLWLIVARGPSFP